MERRTWAVDFPTAAILQWEIPLKSPGTDGKARTAAALVKTSQSDLSTWALHFFCTGSASIRVIGISHTSAPCSSKTLRHSFPRFSLTVRITLFPRRGFLVFGVQRLRSETTSPTITTAGACTMSLFAFLESVPTVAITTLCLVVVPLSIRQAGVLLVKPNSVA